MWYYDIKITKHFLPFFSNNMLLQCTIGYLNNSWTFYDIQFFYNGQKGKKLLLKSAGKVGILMLLKWGSSRRCCWCCWSAAQDTTELTLHFTQHHNYWQLQHQLPHPHPLPSSLHTATPTTPPHPQPSTSLNTTTTDHYSTKYSTLIPFHHPYTMSHIQPHPITNPP